MRRAASAWHRLGLRSNNTIMFGHVDGPASWARHLLRVRELQSRFPDYGIDWDIYVTAPGAELDGGHPLVGALEESHADVFGSPPERDVTRWFSDASVLTRYGIATVNYGTSSGLLDTVKGADLGLDDGRLVLDFNLAYQPSCSYDPAWACPLAPPENRLPTAVRAGERLGP